MFVPSKNDVASFYDKDVSLINLLSGANVHVGYWTSPDDRSSLREATDRMTDMVIGRLAVGRGARVLDVGCGLGTPAIRLAQQTDVTVLGIATSPNLIDHANEAAHAAGVEDRVTFELGDGEELAYADGSFDAVMAIESLVHMTDRLRAFQGIARVLRPGGRLVLTDRVEKTPPTDRQREIIEAYRKLSMNAPFLKLDEYLRTLIDTQLVPMEYLDITVETVPHYAHMMDALDRDAAGSSQAGSELVAAGKAVLSDLIAARLPTNMLVTAEAA